MMKAQQEQKQKLTCPACGAASISPRHRQKLAPFWHLQCIACQVYLRLKWGRLLALIWLAALLLVAAGVFVGIPGFHKLPTGLLGAWTLGLAASFNAMLRRLPLQPKP
jgi:hypothetical protein